MSKLIRNILILSALGVMACGCQHNSSSSATTATTTSETSGEPIISSSSEPIVPKAKWTIMIYMCGSDLESSSFDGGYATMDLKEIVNTSNKPDDFNIVIQTGGAKSWKKTYGIDPMYSQRWEVKNGKLIEKQKNSRCNMGLSKTLQNFVEYGLNEYPADNNALIFWNHGGAMAGVCADEQYNDDYLLNSEVISALKGAYQSTGFKRKMNFVGYDACLMQVQDIADTNSEFFDYMVASEEAEAGEGWVYNNLLGNLYAGKSLDVTFKSLCDSFIEAYSESAEALEYPNDQTLSYLDLSKNSDYKNAWEEMATALYSKLESEKVSSTTFRNWVNSNVKYFGEEYYATYGVWDSKDFVQKLASSKYSPGNTYTDSVLEKMNDFIKYSAKGEAAGNANGLAVPFPIRYSSTFSKEETNYSSWYKLISKYGA